MDKRQIGLLLVLKHLGIPLRYDTPEQRRIVQCAVYLAQASGVHLGYFFQWRPWLGKFTHV